MKPILNIENLTKIYGNVPSQTKALNGITFQVMPGEFLGIMGSSGSGKSTLLNCIATVIRDVENADLELALKSSTEELQNVIFRNLSKRLAAMIKEDMDFMGPVRMKDVEEAQQKVVAVIRKLEDSGDIVISRGGGDDIVV